MASFTLEEVLKATDGKLLHPVHLSRAFTRVETDTRTIDQGALFVALKGEKFDGHDFAIKAFENGATGIVVQENRPEYNKEGLAVIIVADTLKAYQHLARFHRRRFRIPIVAVTGSVGKTTTRGMIAAVLEQKFRVLQTEKNFNNEIGLPRTLLQLTPEHDACVVEMGMRGLGQIAELAAIAEPTIGVVTNVGKSHIELLGSQENIAKAKSELIQALPADGAAVLNQDDPFVAPMSDLCRGKVFGFGFGKNTVTVASRTSCDEKGIHFSCRCFDEVVEIHMPVIGKHNIYNALAAVSVGRILGVSLRQAQKGLAEYKGMAMRQELVYIGTYTFINDAYNANPASMAEAIRSLAVLASGRKIAVLGDMLELGQWAQKEHEAIGAIAAENGIDMVITLGELARYIGQSAHDHGIAAVYAAQDHGDAAAYLKKVIQPGDTVLLKGSRGMAMEKLLPYFERK